MVSSVSSSASTLSTYFTTIISNQMKVEQKPLTRLQDERDTLNTTRSVYLDLKSYVDDLTEKTKSLISTNAFYNLKLGRTATSSKTDVLSATASSSAPTGSYDISVTKLATAQRRISGEQTKGNSTALGLSGTFYLGGNGPESQSATISGTASGKVSSVTKNATISDSAHELETGTYTVETQVNDGQLQFRLLNSDGNAVGIGDDNSTAWQNVDAGGTFDTGRGMVINFSGTGAGTSTTVNYQAMGRAVSVDADDTLIDISNKINLANQPGDNGIGATVIGNQMVLTNRETGAGNRMVYSSWLAENLGFASDLNDENLDLQKPSDAQITVNGMSKVYTSSSNTNVTNIIQGLSLNLTDEGDTTLTVAGSSDTAVNTMNDFIKSFNTLTAYLKAKTGVTEGSDGNYTRGTLSGDSSFYDLRSNLFQAFAQQISGGRFSSMGDIGLSINDNLELEISDQSKFTNAIKNYSSDVTHLVDSVAGNILSNINRFSGSDGFLTKSVANFDNEIKEIGSKITDTNTRLSERYNYLVDKYSQIQSQLILLSYTYSSISSYYGTSSSSSSTTTNTSA
jgi:flagellar hook-associated protein 2